MTLLETIDSIKDTVFLSTFQGVSTHENLKEVVRGDWSTEEAGADVICFPVNSSMIAFVGYNPAARVLEVRFKNKPNTAYRYRGVTTDKWGAMVQAPSIGKFFHAEIKSAHPDFLVTAPRLYSIGKTVKREQEQIQS